MWRVRHRMCQADAAVQPWGRSGEATGPGSGAFADVGPYGRSGAASADPAPACRAIGLRKTGPPRPCTRSFAPRGPHPGAGSRAREEIGAYRLRSLRGPADRDLPRRPPCALMDRRIGIAGPGVARLPAALADRVARRSRRPARAAGRVLRRDARVGCPPHALQAGGECQQLLLLRIRQPGQVELGLGRLSPGRHGRRGRRAGRFRPPFPVLDAQCLPGLPLQALQHPRPDHQVAADAVATTGQEQPSRLGRPGEGL
jgi:hypothetical protein